MGKDIEAVDIDEAIVDLQKNVNSATSHGMAPDDALGNTTRQQKVTSSWELGDVESLKQQHTDAAFDLDNIPDHNEETAVMGGDYVKAFVLGGLDGIVSTFALVSSLGGAHVNIGTLIAVTLAKVLADAFSMGYGEFTSASAELESGLRLKAREEWETANFLEGEVKEMVQIYIKRGVLKEDAFTIMNVMSKYKDLFVDHMMVMEHGVMSPDADDKWAPLKQGLVCFFAFAAFGLIPLLGFIIMYAIQGDTGNDTLQIMGIAYGLTALTLLIMGFAKAKLTGEKRIIKSGLVMVINGTIAGSVAYLIGEALAGVF